MQMVLGKRHRLGGLKVNIVVAMDSFKGSLTSLEAGRAIEAGIKRVSEDQVKVCPLADGGEGTVEALVSGMNGTLHTVMVTGPLGEPVSCNYGIIEHSKTAIIEMSGAAGITFPMPESIRCRYSDLPRSRNGASLASSAATTGIPRDWKAT